MAAIIFGEAPNRVGRQKYQTRSGARMRELCGGKELVWVNLFDDNNRPDSWDPASARERADAWAFLHESSTSPLLLLGRRVCAAFGIKDLVWLDWYRSPKLRSPLIAIPHPSGLNRWWNDEKNTEAARELLLAVAEERLPHFTHKAKEEK